MPSKPRGNPSPRNKSRQLRDWIEGYLEYAKYTEPPLSYHTWSAVSILASALQRRVYMKWGHSTIYPNQYIVLVGPSGQSRKGEALSIARDLMSEVRIPLTSERVIREAFYRFLKDHASTYTDKTTGRFRIQSAATCVAEELQVFLGKQNTEFLADLTNLYDSRDEWTYETKNSGTDHIVGVCFNLLGATAPDWLPSILPAEAVGGGFTSRVVFVVEDAKGQTISNPNLYQDNLAIREKLIHDLERVMLMTGEMIFSEDALAFYEDWYQTEDARLKSGTQDLVDPRLAGYNSRRATHIKKISMAISAARSNDLIITLEDTQRALGLMTLAEKKMPRVFTGLGKAKFAEATEDVLYLLMREKRVTRSSILSRYYTKIDTFVLDAVEKLLEEMKAIRVERTKGLGDKLYVYLGEGD